MTTDPEGETWPSIRLWLSRNAPWRVDVARFPGAREVRVPVPRDPTTLRDLTKAAARNTALRVRVSDVQRSGPTLRIVVSKGQAEVKGTPDPRWNAHWRTALHQARRILAAERERLRESKRRVQRVDDRARPTSVRTVSGGLPGLGKRH